MPESFKELPVDEDSSLAQILDEARTNSIVLRRGAERFRVEREMEDPLGVAYHTRRVREVLRETVESWADVDTDALIADVYRWRVEGTRKTEARDCGRRT